MRGERLAQLSQIECLAIVTQDLDPKTFTQLLARSSLENTVENQFHLVGRGGLDVADPNLQYALFFNGLANEFANMAGANIPQERFSQATRWHQMAANCGETAFLVEEQDPFYRAVHGARYVTHTGHAVLVANHARLNISDWLEKRKANIVQTPEFLGQFQKRDWLKLYVDPSQLHYYLTLMKSSLATAQKLTTPEI